MNQPKRYARIALEDGSETLPVPDAVLDATFSVGLWYMINDLYDLALDEHEGVLVPVEKLTSVSKEIRSFAQANLSTSEITVPLLEIADALDRAHKRGVPVWFSL